MDSVAQNRCNDPQGRQIYLCFVWHLYGICPRDLPAAPFSSSNGHGQRGYSESNLQYAERISGAYGARAADGQNSAAGKRLAVATVRVHSHPQALQLNRYRQNADGRRRQSEA